jgi:hypothetical protein
MGIDILRKPGQAVLLRGVVGAGAAAYDYDHIVLYHVQGETLSGICLDGAKLSSAVLRLADLTGSSLRLAELYNADMQGCKLDGALMQGAKLAGADLSSARLIGADLSGANLMNANLEGANLSGANVTDVAFRHGKWDDRTVWPHGTMPQFRNTPLHQALDAPERGDAAGRETRNSADVRPIHLYGSLPDGTVARAHLSSADKELRIYGSSGTQAIWTLCADPSLDQLLKAVVNLIGVGADRPSAERIAVDVGSSTSGFEYGDPKPDVVGLFGRAPLRLPSREEDLKSIVFPTNNRRTMEPLTILESYPYRILKLHAGGSRARRFSNLQFGLDIRGMLVGFAQFYLSGIADKDIAYGASMAAVKWLWRPEIDTTPESLGNDS